ncbi:uncharacterized protein LOC144328483 [Podarcis muralis]
MWQVPFLRFGCLGLLTLSTAMLLTAMFTGPWVVWPSIFGPAYEDLLKQCFLSTCTSLERDWVYNVTVIGFLVLGATDGAILVVVFMWFSICKKSKRVNKLMNKHGAVPVVATLIGMSVYTGKYTPQVPVNNRGWSFFMAWSCFLLFFIAAIGILFYQVYQEIEEELEDNVVPQGMPNGSYSLETEGAKG